MQAQIVTPSQRAFIEAHKARQARMASRAVIEPRAPRDIRPVSPDPEDDLDEPQQHFQILTPSFDPCWIAIDGTAEEPAPHKRRLMVSDIQKVVAAHFGLSKGDLTSHRRTLNIVRPRQIAVYLSRTMTTATYPEIGRRFGGRDHTTAISSFAKVTTLMKADAAFAATVSNLRRDVEARCA